MRRSVSPMISARTLGRRPALADRHEVLKAARGSYQRGYPRLGEHRPGGRGIGDVPGVERGHQAVDRPTGRYRQELRPTLADGRARSAPRRRRRRRYGARRCRNMGRAEHNRNAAHHHKLTGSPCPRLRGYYQQRMTCCSDGTGAPRSRSPVPERNSRLPAVLIGPTVSAS